MEFSTAAISTRSRMGSPLSMIMLASPSTCAAPELLVDCATLTGASRVALGTDVPSVFCNDRGIEHAEQLVSLSATEQDQVWRLPLWQGYREQIDSKVVDLKT